MDDQFSGYLSVLLHPANPTSGAQNCTSLPNSFKRKNSDDRTHKGIPALLDNTDLNIG